MTRRHSGRFSLFIVVVIFIIVAIVVISVAAIFVYVIAAILIFMMTASGRAFMVFIITAECIAGARPTRSLSEVALGWI